MVRISRRFVLLGAIVLGPLALEHVALGAKPTPTVALQLTPVQADVDFDRPAAADVEKAHVVANEGTAGWLVTTEGGQILRRFLDTNSDGSVDQWCYFKNGIEVYRDIDANFNGKADEYRWLGMAGVRWGLDTNEDGKIDVWKAISPEEVTAEVVAAIRENDVNRFKRVLLTDKELKALGLGEEQMGELAEKVTAAPAQFSEIAKKQKSISADSEWIYFGGTRPGVAPAGVNGSTKDVIIYDNVSAVIETKGKHSQVAVGTLVRVDEGWRVIEAPRSLLDGEQGQGAGGYFFQVAMLPRQANEGGAEGGLTKEMQQLVNDLDRLEKEASKATTPQQQAKQHAERADILEKLTRAAPNEEERALWTRQFADRVSSAVQEGTFPDGMNRLKAMFDRLEKDSKSKELAGYVKFRYMTAEYGQNLQKPKTDVAKVQSEWLENLRAFVKDYATTTDAAEAMLQLAIAEEFAGKEDEATTWYTRIVSEFGSSEVAKKAAGAKRRLESVGKSIELKARTLDGRTFDLSQARGTVVVIHYWATWCEPCKQDIETMKRLQAKYAKQKLLFVGVNLDSEAQTVTDYLKTNRIPWAQLYETGGLDSRLASEMGVLTLPTMIVVDKNGRVTNRAATAGELDAELGKLLR